MPAPTYSAPDRRMGLTSIFSGGWANAAATANFLTFGRPGPTGDLFNGLPTNECCNVFSNHHTGDDWQEFILTPATTLVSGQRARSAWGGFLYTTSSIRLDQDWELGMQIKFGAAGYVRRPSVIGFILCRGPLGAGNNAGTGIGTARIDSYLEAYLLEAGGTNGTPFGNWIRADNVASSGSAASVAAYGDNVTREHRANYNIAGKQLEVGVTGSYGSIALGATWESNMVINGIRNQIGNEAFVGMWWSSTDSTDSLQAARISAFSIHGTAGSRRIISTSGIPPTSGTALTNPTEGLFSRLTGEKVADPVIKVAGRALPLGDQPVIQTSNLTGQIFPRGQR